MSRGKQRLERLQNALGAARRELSDGVPPVKEAKLKTAIAQYEESIHNLSHGLEESTGQPPNPNAVVVGGEE